MRAAARGIDPVADGSPEHGDAAAGAHDRCIETHPDRPVGLTLIAARLVHDACDAQACGPVPVVGRDVAEHADLAALRYCGHAAGGHCDRHAVAQAAIVIVD